MPHTEIAAGKTRIARTAGALYAAIIVLGLTSELFVRSALVVPGDAAATAANILGAEGLFRLSLSADTAMAAADVAVAVLLFVLLRPVSPVLAALAAAFRLTQTAVIAGNLLNQHAALAWLTSATLPGVPPETAAALALQAIDLHATGYDLGLVFFGVSSTLIGFLLIRSPEFPRWLGHLMIAAGAVYVTGSTLRFVAPSLMPAFQPAYLVAVVAETALALRLLSFGWRRGGQAQPAL